MKQDQIVTLIVHLTGGVNKLWTAKKGNCISSSGVFCQDWHPNMVIEGSPGAALSQQGLKAGHEVDNSEFKLEKGTRATAMHTQELRAQ